MNRIGSSTAVLGLISLAFASHAWGQDVAPANEPRGPGATIGVAYDAPSSCPDASVFMARLRARTEHADLAPAGEGARFAVMVSSTETASSALIQFSGADALPVTRAVNGRTCDEVVSAAALITALSIEASWTGAPTMLSDPRSHHLRMGSDQGSAAARP